MNANDLSGVSSAGGFAETCALQTQLQMIKREAGEGGRGEWSQWVSEDSWSRLYVEVACNVFHSFFVNNEKHFVQHGPTLVLLQKGSICTCTCFFGANSYSDYKSHWTLLLWRTKLLATILIHKPHQLRQVTCELILIHNIYFCGSY